MTHTPTRSALVSALRQFAGLWGFLLFILFVLVVFRAVILPFVLGTLVAYVLAPVVNRIARAPGGRARMPRFMAVIMLYLGLGTAIGLFLTAFMPRLSADFARLFREAPRFLTKVRKSYVPKADVWLAQNFPGEELEESEPRPERKLTVIEKAPGRYEISLEGLELEVAAAGKGRYVVGPRSDGDEKRPHLGDLLGRAASATESELKNLLLVGQRFVTGVLKTVAWFVLTLMVAAYLLVDAERVTGFLRSLVPAPQQPAFDELIGQLDAGLAGVIRGQMVICLLNGVLTTIGLYLFHVKYLLLLGTLAGAMSFIPVFGTILSSVPIVAVALAAGDGGLSLSTGVGVLGWIIGVHFFEAYLFNPKIIGTAAKIHPVVVVFALLVGEETGGLVGVLLAVPVASTVQTVFLFFRRRTPAQGIA